MLKNSPNMAGANVTKRNDPRVLPFGKILRKTKINELPQLFNIWVGQMSIVGPRPLTVDQYYNYSKEQQAYISKLTPGIIKIKTYFYI
jgi:lipopolysaccharide/colanic/teichoic acid biosynthesis glycosyltransferase